MKLFKRLFAYLIDMLILGLMFFILHNLLPTSTVVQVGNHNLAILEEQLLKEQITITEYLNQFISISYQVDKANIVHTGINILLIIIYFIIIPIITKGKTIGLYLMKLKIDGKLSIFNLFIRNIITTGILYMIIYLILISFVDEKIYFYSITILGFIQFLLVIISTFMIIYRKDKKGLQDIFSNTEIKEVSK
jgi:uncharacterized RDD family membrane protein YckC